MPRISNPQNFKGENLISKEEIGLASGDVLVVSGQVASGFLPEFTGYADPVSGTSKVYTKAPFTGPNINFIGDCTMIVEKDGSITIRIGDNLNSSNFGTKDGVTSGVDTVSVTSPSTTANAYLSGTSVVAISGGNYSIDTKSANSVIHFDSQTVAGFKVVVNDAGTNKTYFFGPIDMTTGVSSGKKTFTAKLTDASGAVQSGVTLEISDWGPEPTAGATGWKGNIKFTIPAASIAGGDASYVSVVSVEYIYDSTDTTSKTTSVTASGTKCYYYTIK